MLSCPSSRFGAKRIHESQSVSPSRTSRRASQSAGGCAATWRELTVPSSCASTMKTRPSSRRYSFSRMRRPRETGTDLGPHDLGQPRSRTARERPGQAQTRVHSLPEPLLDRPQPCGRMDEVEGNDELRRLVGQRVLVATEQQGEMRLFADLLESRCVPEQHGRPRAPRDEREHHQREQRAHATPPAESRSAANRARRSLRPARRPAREAPRRPRRVRARGARRPRAGACPA